MQSCTQTSCSQDCANACHERIWKAAKKHLAQKASIVDVQCGGKAIVYTELMWPEPDYPHELLFAAAIDVLEAI